MDSSAKKPGVNFRNEVCRDAFGAGGACSRFLGRGGPVYAKAPARRTQSKRCACSVTALNTLLVIKRPIPFKRYSYRNA